MALSSQSTPKSAEKDQKPENTTRTKEADEPIEARNDVDQVAQVSRTASGEAHQNPGYELIGLPDDATEAQKAAAENRPRRRKTAGGSKDDSSDETKSATGSTSTPDTGAKG